MAVWIRTTFIPPFFRVNRATDNEPKRVLYAAKAFVLFSNRWEQVTRGLGSLYVPLGMTQHICM